MNAKNKEAPNPIDHDEVVITRSFNAPRELVFKAWTDPKRVAHWWGPKGFTNPVCEMDVRIEGLIHIDMRSPDGTIYPMKGVFREIVAPERLVLTTSALDEKGVPMFKQLQTITFADDGSKTTVVVHMRVLNTKAEAAHYLKGYKAGMTQSLERLEDYLIKS